jgi:SEC-C motif
MSKKKINSTPRRKRMKRQSRLQAAKHWIVTYNGKNLIKGYQNWFGVDLLCTIQELKMLGLKLDDQYVHQALYNREKMIAAKQKKTAENNTHYGLINDDDISSMKHWACFSEKIEKRIESDLEYHKPEKTSYHHAPVLPSLRTSPKIGRNDPCPCNSGKKYKKCCIATH